MQRQIDWSRVIDFIAQRDVALASSLVGVEPSQIEAVQAQFGIELPSAYVNFLRTMGEETGILMPFGDTQVHAFSELIAEFPPDGYPPKRFFKVAFEASQYPVAVLDTYLDVTRSDGLDAPLVRFEIPLENERTELVEAPLSFAETVFYRMFWELDMIRRDFEATLVVQGLSPVDARATKDSAVTSLAELGFTMALPELVRVACLNRESSSLLISISDVNQLVAFRLSGDTREAIDIGMRDVLASCPGAVVSRPPSRRSESEV